METSVCLQRPIKIYQNEQNSKNLYFQGEKNHFFIVIQRERLKKHTEYNKADSRKIQNVISHTE
jgi:hypothetical protein